MKIKRGCDFLRQFLDEDDLIWFNSMYPPPQSIPYTQQWVTISGTATATYAGKAVWDGITCETKTDKSNNL